MLDTIIFTTCDVVSLVAQAVGGAAASTAVSNHNSPTNVRLIFGSACSALILTVGRTYHARR